MQSFTFHTFPFLPIARETEEIASTAAAAMSIPKELWRMVDYLYHRGCNTTGLWTDKGVEGEEAIIRDMLDQGIPFPELEYVLLQWLNWIELNRIE